MAILATNPTTAEDPDVGRVVSSRLSGQASVSGLGIPHASSNAGPQSTLQQKPFAGSDTLEYVNEVLVREGFGTFDTMSNESVIAKYKPCSNIGHQLSILTRPGVLAGLRARPGTARRAATASGADGCLDADVDAVIGKSAKCEHCKKRYNFNRSTHRWTALLNEPDENAWMAFICLDVTSPTSRMFPASHRCHTRILNNCINSEHVFLETVQTNADRDKHHRVCEPCNHDRPCLGVGVLPLPRSS